ncbi:MAG: hypothetical protein BWY83_03287 [bacterium ADurb.Bin478]|nr:MAG: hypothetical protein BWY83_03287 [bacterium ADurb.Bin478]
MKKVWLSGWASDLTRFLPQIEKSFPDDDHQAISWVELFTGDLAELRAQLSSADQIIAWSQGAQLLFHRQLLSQEVNSSLRAPLLLVAPALDFCRAGSGWPLSVLRAMARALEKDRKSVLNSFAEKMGATAEEISLWCRSANSIDRTLLAEGLMMLAEPVLLSPLQKIPHLILQGSSDRIVKQENSASLSLEWKLQMQIVEGAGHWLLTPKMIGAIQRVSTDG